MKKVVTLAFAIAALFLVRPAAAQEKAKWNEKDAFHEVMSKTFHPAEEGKLEPIKARSAEMVQKAIAWKQSTAPAGYDKNAVKKELGELVKGAKKVDKLVKKNAADNEIKAQLTELHELFHTITEKCDGEEKH